MADSRPNIMLLMTDQQRGDALGIEDHPVLQTPHVDHIGAAGIHFRRAYAACPVCIPARRTLMTGQKPATHGALMNCPNPLPPDVRTLAGELRRAGYQTHVCGKMHLLPYWRRHGFDSMDWADSPAPSGNPMANDYQRYLLQHGVTFPYASGAHGANSNDWMVRPWHLDEQMHFTNWTVNRALDFLNRRDPACPFFLKVSVIHPHQPNTPPPMYYQRYLDLDLPEPFVGDWARVYEKPPRGLNPANTWRICLEPAVMHQMRAAYYGSINHISDQFARLLHVIPKNTIIIYLSDHGEMLGDHQWLRKRTPWEPSARIPLLMQFPRQMGIDQPWRVDQLVELRDVMPTLLDAVGAEIPDTVEGRSLMPLLRGESDEWRDYLHGECCSIAATDTGMQYIVTRKWKYVWFPGLGAEQLFDLENDPREMVDLSGSKSHADELDHFRHQLTEKLRDRPEGFTDGKQLKQLDGATSPYIGEDYDVCV